jgi:hypothetical protein
MILLVVLIVAAPWIVAHTGLRDRAINTILASPSVTATSDSASFSWFSPLSIQGLRLTSANNHVQILVGDITADQSLLQLWSSSPDLGTITVDKPHVLLEWPLDVQLQERKSWLEPTFKAITKNAGLTVRLAGEDEPVLDVEDIDMAFRVEKAEEGRVLTLDPMVVFEKRKVSPKLASKLLHLFDPTMSDTPQISGAVSLSVDKVRVPIGVPREQAVKQMVMEGKLVLHDVLAEVKNPMRQTLVRLVADMNGKKASDVVHLAHNDEIRFQVRDGRLHHEGLRIGFPDLDPKLQLVSRGSVGLDKTIDLFVDLPRLDEAVRKAKGPAKCRITGTIGNPKIAVEDASLVLRQPGHKEPIVAADGINLKMQVENTPSGHVVVVEPVEVFKKKKLSLGVADRLMKLIAPDLSGEQQVAGEISLSFSKLRFPLGLDKDEEIKRFEGDGKVKLHQVSAEVKSPMWLGLFRLLADLNGKKPPKAMHIVEDSEIQFQVRDGRMHYDGVRVSCPEFDPGAVITSRGSVGLDETLDLFVDLPRLDEVERKAKGPAKCRITGTISKPKIAIEDASLVLRQPGHKEPTLAADGINLTMHVETTPSGLVLVVDPVEVFKNKKLSLGVSDGLMKYIAPDVRSERQVTGEISLSFSKLRLPLGLDKDQEIKRFEGEGKVKLHQVSSEIKSPLWQSLIRLLADLKGKKPSSVIHLVEESEIPFQVRDGRLFHEGQRIGFPEIDPDLVITSRGSIGVDETLDLFVELPRLVKGKGDKGPHQCRITGSINQPKISIPDATLVVQLTDGGKAALRADGVNLNFTVETAGDARMLTLAPVTVFNKQKFSPEIGDELLHLISPSLQDIAGVQGEFSLSLDKFGIPLGVAKDDLVKKIVLAGKLQLQGVSVDAKTPLLQTMVKVLADMHGKKPTDVVRVVQNADVRFHVKDGRMFQEGLRFGFPDISPDLLISARGSVGYDKSLDIVLDVPAILLDKDNPATKTAPVRLRITGTLDKPIVKDVKDEPSK